MKTLKILSLGIFTVLISCGPSEYNGGNNILNDWGEDFIDGIIITDNLDNKKYFNPPEWIMGTWYYENHDGELGVHFSESDVIDLFYGIPASHNTILNIMINGKKKYSLNEEVTTDSTYFFSILKNIDPNYIDNYLFKKISNDSIIEIRSGSESNYTATLLRFN